MRAFGHLLYHLKVWYDTVGREHPDMQQIAIAHAAYQNFDREFQKYVGHYFRNLYYILRFIAESKIDNADFYAGILRAQLSSNELLLLFYDAASPIYAEKFKPLITHFRFLKSLPKATLFHPSHLDMYDPKAFGEL